MYHNIPDARLLDILNKLGLDKFANTQALDTMIVENGANLSGGEPQISDSAMNLLLYRKNIPGIGLVSDGRSSLGIWRGRK